MTDNVTREGFATRLGFIFASIGGAVGLGNIWRFPYVVGESGGGAFILIYLVFVFALGMPALMATVLIGRRGGQSPINTVRKVAVDEGRSPNWYLLGWIMVWGGFAVITFFSIVAGWALDSLLESMMGAFVGIDAEGSRLHFELLQSDPLRLIFWHTLFMGMTVYIIARGIRAGLERAVNWMMPALFALLSVFVIYAAFTGEFLHSLEFMFAPDFSKIDANVVIIALGQAMFSLSVSGGGMMVYASYMSKDASITKSVSTIVAADTFVALLAGLAIFPIVFAYGMDSAEGPGLIFVTLPVAFGQMPAGAFFGTVFFAFLLIAALTSALGMLEPVVAWLCERYGVRRSVMAMAAGAAAWLIGLANALSFNEWSDFKPLSMFDTFADMRLFEIIVFVSTSFIAPISAFFIVIFAGWMMSRSSTTEELNIGSDSAYGAWRFMVRFVIPLALVAIFLANLL